MEYIFYEIRCLDSSITETYIGSTMNFTRRKCQHKGACNRINDKKHHLKLYKIIRANNGWTNWEMVPIDKQVFETKLDARLHEQKLIKEHKATLNSATASVPREMYELGLQMRNRT